MSPVRMRHLAVAYHVCKIDQKILQTFEKIRVNSQVWLHNFVH